MVPELHRLSVDDATAWVDRATSLLPTESVSLFAACARVLADGICAVQPIPLADCAALDASPSGITASVPMGIASPAETARKGNKRGLYEVAPTVALAATAKRR